MKNRCPDCCHPESFFADACGCCRGIESITPRPVFNRPGLSQLSHRIGSHVDFLESMRAHLANKNYPSLAGLTSRDGDDPTLALLDGWATVADVLTFYTERIANEGFLRSATERRSIVELAGLVGYTLQPGVAASVFLAYTLDEKFTGESIIPAGSRVQSIPGPGELPQSFESNENLKARAKWNNLKPRLSKPQTELAIRNHDANGNSHPLIYLKGVTTNLKPNDPLLIDFGQGATPEFFKVYQVIPDLTADRTLIRLGQATPPTPTVKLATQQEIIAALTLPPSQQPPNALRLKRALTEQFKTGSETGYAALKILAPLLKPSLSLAAANATVTPTNPIRAYALRRRASLFGHNVPQRTRVYRGELTIIGDWPIIERASVAHEEESVVYLDASYDDFLQDDWIVIKTPSTRLTDSQTMVLKAGRVDTSLQHANYGITAPTTRIELPKDWIKLSNQGPSRLTDNDFNAIRATTVFGAPEALDLAEQPICQIICGGLDDPIELDGFYEGLESGRWVIVSGERDLPQTSGVRFSELAMLAAISQDTDPALSTGGEQTHTFIKLAKALQYCFKRDSITIYGNVVKATHGETRKEILGSGDGAKPMQTFSLKQKPLTYTAAAKPSGVDSTLAVRVNEVLWHEADTFTGMTATDRRFITRTDDDDTTTVIFGNGQEGARLPTGVENVKAQYRVGIGQPGNAKAGQISLLADRPLGVREVVNPLPASGGADCENREQARKNAPLAVKALERLISVQDYADFARSYAGIGKASAMKLSMGRQSLVHVTIAGADDIPIDSTSDLFMNLYRSLRALGDPFQPVQLAVRELLLLVISAKVRLDPDYLWEDVAARLRVALLAAFGFESRELGQNVYLSEVYAVMQAVRGVKYVAVDSFGGVPEKITAEGGRRLLTPDEIIDAVGCIALPKMYSGEDHLLTVAMRRLLLHKDSGDVAQTLRVSRSEVDGNLIHPAQLAILSADLPDTLILNPIQ